MDTRTIYFLLGLLALVLLCGYVRNLGRKAGVPAPIVAFLERLAILG